MTVKLILINTVHIQIETWRNLSRNISRSSHGEWRQTRSRRDEREEGSGRRKVVEGCIIVITEIINVITVNS